MPVYARHGVPYLWLVDPLAHTLEVFALREERWTVIGLFQEQDASVSSRLPTLPWNWVRCGQTWKSNSLL
ncbi:MAG: Uma2 family endonuclease [Candidatus Competibacteraceae bacterium]